MYVCVAVLLSAPEADTETISAASTANAPSAPNDRSRMCVSPLYQLRAAVTAPSPSRRIVYRASITLQAGPPNRPAAPLRRGRWDEPDVATLRGDALHDHVTRADEHVRVGADLDVAQEHPAARRRRICGHCGGGRPGRTGRAQRVRVRHGDRAERRVREDVDVTVRGCAGR